MGIIHNGYFIFYCLVAIKNNNFEITRALFEDKNIDVNIQDNEGLTPLMWGIALFFYLFFKFVII